MCFQVHVFRSFHFNFADRSSALCSSSSRAAVTPRPRFARAVAGGVARLREPLVDRDPAAADITDRSLRLLARLPRLRRDTRLQPLEVRVPAVELPFDGVGEGLPVVGEIRDHRVLGNGDPRRQLPELRLDLVRSTPCRGCDEMPPRAGLRRGDAGSAISPLRRQAARAPAAARPGGEPRQAAPRSSLCPFEPPLRLFFDSTKGRARRCQRSARRGDGCQLARPARSGAFSRELGELASSSSAPVAGFPASATKRLSRGLVRPLRLRPLEDLAVQRARRSPRHRPPRRCAPSSTRA